MAKKTNARVETRLNKTQNFQIVEAYKTIRTNLQFALSVAERKIVLISSAEPGAGKSTTSSNLAVAVAQTGARVLIIDGDMRKPTQHKIFRVSNNKGLSQVLSSLCSFEEALHVGVLTNVDVLCAGLIPPNPSELLGSRNMVALLDQVSERYDYIIIDTAPLAVVSDALTLLDQVAGVVLVARQRQTTYELLEKSVQSVRQMEGNVLGVVITNVQLREKLAGSQYYKKSYYSYESKLAGGDKGETSR